MASFEDELMNAVSDGIREILDEGLDVECPLCGEAFTLDLADPKCPKCGKVVRIEA